MVNSQWSKSINKYEYASDERYHKYLAEEFLKCARNALSRKGSFIAVLGGGKTPKYINSWIVALNSRYKIDWNNVHIVLSDERWIEEGNDFSNYKMFLETLTVPLGIQPLYRIYSNRLTIQDAAKKYAHYIQGVWNESGCEAFDYALLGVGSDGHTASLFPKRTIGTTNGEIVICGGKGPEGLERISLSYEALNKCECISFIINSSEKKKVLDQMEMEWDPLRFPIQNIIVPKKMHILTEEQA